jgi:hypothetical protein
MSCPTIDRLKQIHGAMASLKEKRGRNVDLTANQQANLDQLAAEYDEAMMSLFLPVYYRSSMPPHTQTLLRLSG